MLISRTPVDLAGLDRRDRDLLVYSEHVMGNGSVTELRDIVYVKPDVFEARLTSQIAHELESVNRSLQSKGKRYVLIGFGRWGSSEPWLGIPVHWEQISAAAVIVEATRPEMNVELSQGSHFFHNIQSLEVSYFCVQHQKDPPIDWEWLSRQTVVSETETLRHVVAGAELRVKADGRTGRGAIWHDQVTT